MLQEEEKEIQFSKIPLTESIHLQSNKDEPSLIKQNQKEKPEKEET